MDFVHLHCHSNHSLENGVASVQELARHARDLGMSALALTDHDTLAGAIPFCEACRRVGIRPVIGCQLSVLGTNAKATRDSLFRLVVLVETDPGYRNLVSLINTAYARAKHDRPYLRLADFRECATGLIAITGGDSSELFSLMLHDKHEETEAHVTEIARIFGRDNVVFELQDHNLPKQKQINDRLLKLSEFLSMRCVATNDVHYLRPEDSVCHSFLLGEAPPRRLDLKELRLNALSRHLASPDEMRSKFSKHPRILYTTAEIADRCLYQPNRDKKRFPVHDFMRGFDADSFLWDLTFREARSRFSELTPEMKDRLNQEFDQIKTERLSNRILLLWNIAQFCRRNRIILGVGRGDVISSLVAYILGITQVNPLEYKLRFLGLEQSGESEHAIPLEIAARHFPALLQFLKEAFGPDCSAVPGEYTWTSVESLARELCTWLELPASSAEEIVNETAEDLGTEDVHIERFVARRFGSAEFTQTQLAKYMLARLHPRPKSFGPMAHQIAVSSENLNHLLPRIGTDEERFLQADTTTIEALNIPRLVLAPNPALDVLDAAAAWVRQEEYPQFDPEKIPMNDNDTFDLLGRGLTNGIEPFHRVTLKSLLRAHKPKNFMGLLKVRSMEKADGETTDVREHVPECLLTYRCAFIKAHYPISFMAAILSLSYGQPRRFSVLLREARRMGIKILPPHVNISAYEFSQTNKTIRTGLMVANGITRRMYTELEAIRKGGDFHDLADLWTRTAKGPLSAADIGNLIRVGALDSFTRNRAQMLKSLEQLIENDGTQRPPTELPQVAEFDNDELLQHELAAAGYCISSDQLDLHRNVMKKCRALTPYELSTRHVNREVYVAGFIEHAEPEEGEQVLLDLEGRIVSMPLKASRLYEAAVRSSDAVLVGGTVLRKKEEVYLKGLTAFTLRDVARMSAQVTRLELDLSGEDNSTVRLIRKLVRHYRGSRQGTRVQVKNFSGTSVGVLDHWLIERTPVFFSPPFYYALKKILPEDRIELVASQDMDANLLHTLSPLRFPRPGSAASTPSRGEAVEPATDLPQD